MRFPSRMAKPRVARTSRLPFGRLARLSGAAAIVSLCVLGCGGQSPRGEVHGTLRSGDEPLANVLVTFVPERSDSSGGARSAGVTDTAGQYRLTGEDGRPGAIVGRHRVTLQDMAIYAAERSADGMIVTMPPERVSRAYGDPLRTPLVVEVAEGDQSLDLELATKASP